MQFASNVVPRLLIRPLPLTASSLLTPAIRSLQTTPNLSAKKYAKYYFTPKKIYKKEEIYRVPDTQTILEHEKLTHLSTPEAAPISATESDLLNQLISAVNHPQSTSGRAFAIVHLVGKQYKVTEGDLVHLIGKNMLAEPGDQIILEKVLALGFADFTLYGRPLLSRQCVTVRATVVEKTLEPPKINFEFRKRQNFRKMQIIQTNATVLRINSIELNKDAVRQAM